MAGDCNFLRPPLLSEADPRESALNKKLVKLFPNEVYKTGALSGVSEHYYKMRTDSNYINWLGARSSVDGEAINADWTTLEGYNTIKNLAPYDAILDEMGEPVLYEDGAGNVYTRNINLDWQYVREPNTVISPMEFLELVNTLTGEYVVDNDLAIDVFIKDSIDKAYREQQQSVDAEKAQISSMPMETELDMKMKKRAIKNSVYNYKMLKKLKALSTEEDLQRKLTNRVKARLVNNNYKFYEDNIAKEDSENEINRFDMDKDETSNRAIEDPEILKFLSSIPVFDKYYEDISEQLELSNTRFNPLLRTTVYMNQADVWGILEEEFANIMPALFSNQYESKDIFENYMVALKEKVHTTKSPALNYIYNYLDNLDKAEDVSDPQLFATKMVSTFFRTKSNYLITQVQTELDAKNNYKTTFKIVDPGEKNSKVQKLADEYIQTVIQRKPFQTKNEYQKIHKELTEKFSKLARGGTPQQYRDFTKEIVNDVLKLNLSDQIIDHFIIVNGGLDENGIAKVGGVKRMLAKLLIEKATSTDLASRSIGAVIGEMGLLAKFALKEKQRNSDVDAITGYLMSEGSFMRSLALSAKIFSKDVSESSVIVGGSKRWSYSSVSGLDMFVNRLKNNDSVLLQRLRDRGVTMIDHLGKGDDFNQTFADMIKVYNNSEIKRERDNNPVAHKRIGEIDDHLDKFAKLFNSADTFNMDIASKKQSRGSILSKQQIPYKNYIPGPESADKNTAYSIYGLPTPGMTGSVYNESKKELGSDLKEILDGYLTGEIKEAHKASETIEEYMSIQDPVEKRAYLMKNLLPGYHYNSKKDIESEELTGEDFSKGTYYRLGIFAPAVNKFMNSSVENKALYIDESLGFPKVDGNMLNAKAFRTLMETVYDDVNANILKDYEYLKDIILVRKKEDDKVIEVSLFDIKSNINMGTKDQKIFRYIVSSFLSAYEVSTMLNGNISYYKQSDPTSPDLTDFLKRSPAAVTDGSYLHHRDRRNKALTKNGNKSLTENQKADIEKYYLSYEHADLNINSEQGKKVRKVIKDADDATVAAVMTNMDDMYSRFAEQIETASGNKIKLKHEIGDAQGITTPKHFKDILTRIYGWSDYDTQMEKELLDPDHKITDRNIRWIKMANKSRTPLKMVYFKLDDNGVPVYFKYSLAPMYPALTKGSEMERVLNQMEKQGVEQVVFKSGSKVSNPAPTTIHNSENNLFTGLKEDFKFNPFEIDNMHLKMQVEMPTKTDKNSKVAIQSVKNITANMDFNSEDRVYEYLPPEKAEGDAELKPEMLTAEDAYDMLQDSSRKMLQTGLSKALNKLGYNENPKPGESKFDQAKVKSLLIGELNIETERDLISLLRTDLPIETVPNMAQRAYPKLSAYLTKTAGKIYTNGGSVVQVANTGYDRLTDEEANGVFYFSEQKELTPPLPVTNSKGQVVYFNEEGKQSTTKKDGYHMRIQKAKILLPFSSVFAKTGLSDNEFMEMYKKGDIDARIFQNAMGYRMPNQSMASNDSFEIVGILPPLAGDQAIVYHEITAKTGSDFDIDKMYLALSNFDVQYAKNGWSTAKQFIRDENITIDDMLNILDLEGYESDPSAYADNAQIRDVFVQAVLFNPETEEGSDYEKSHGKQKVTGLKYSTKGLRGEQNNFVTLLNTIIQSPASYNDLMSPLDNPIVKNTIRKQKYLKSINKAQREEFQAKPAKERDTIVEEFTAQNKLTGMQQMMPVARTKARTDMLEAKTLIAIMANNMSDLSESQKAGFGLKFDFGIRNAKGISATTMDRIFMLDGDNDPNKKLTKIVSYLMNASVDAAKDNYIIEGNFTSYSANSAMLLTRLGMNPDDMFSILMNDEILKFSRYKTYQRAKLSDYNFDYNAEELDKMAISLLEKIKKQGDLFSVITRDDFIDNNPAKKDEILAFWHLTQQMGKEFNNAVVAMKSDANGAGKNISELIVLNNRLARLDKDITKNSEYKWFYNGRGDGDFNMRFNPRIGENQNAKMLGTMANNTLFLMNELSEDLFIETSPRVREAVNNILGGLGDPLSTSADSIALIYKYMYPDLLYQTGHDIYKITPEIKEDLLKDFPSRLKAYALSPEAEGNLFLEHLSIQTNKTKNLIMFPKFKNFSDDNLEIMKQDIVGMMNHFQSLSETHPDKHILDDLVKYAFLTTGTKNTYFDFNNLIPATYYVNKGHGAAIKEFMAQTSDIDFRKAMTLMAQVNHNNFKIVKKVPKAMKIPTDDRPVTHKKSLERITLKNGNFAPFVKHDGNLKILVDVENGAPIYYRSKILNEKGFNTYSFDNVDDQLFLQRAEYESAASNLFKNSTPEIDENISDISEC